FANALSAKYRNSFAYTTIKDRLPVILTKVIDTLHCSRCQFASTDNPQEGSIDCVRQAIGHLSELRYKLSTDKALANIEDNLNDALMWNNSLSEYRGKYNLDPTWFTAPWLLCECYFYRKIWEIINTNLPIKDWDPFAKQKEQSWLSTYATIESLAKMFNETMLSFCNCASLEQARPHIEDIVQVCLLFCSLGNKCDLSLSCGEAVHEAKALDMLFLKKLEKFILINNMPALFSYLQRSSTKPNSTVDIILDNVGLELFADLCLADTLLQLKLASKDFLLTLNNLNNQQDGNVKLLSSRWSTFLKNGTFVLTKHTFWTSPYAYYEMRRDLNYRKLVGDLNWPPTTPFEQALIGFKPCPILALRTVKADTVAGLKPGQSEQLTATDPHWMISGEYGIIQFYDTAS
ncbi:Damage-control phosphatase ARMT1, partial [Trichinella spiralis]